MKQSHRPTAEAFERLCAPYSGTVSYTHLGISEETMMTDLPARAISMMSW